MAVTKNGYQLDGKILKQESTIPVATASTQEERVCASPILVTPHKYLWNQVQDSDRALKRRTKQFKSLEESIHTLSE